MCYVLPSTNADITFPRADKDKLILTPSFIVSPDALVFDNLSEPARSTKFSLPAVIDSFPSILTSAST